ncbi:hypothetical protein A2707_00795 [Candidatus Saccharibacteria bacterium RIFCSPHIGHO2_01_FULL_45_15]|nr:MAG: hypothetical protein A2707_00795 [Candidatus Saccharibacteria bacterium RIFCSPHIGHO2_01_FULL_45_15]OGL26911.1 MAG: hypothetical protein A3C39_01910 [Candidatus Saccharibacteria bacterium RIFCSPHIGHO2_02_FULL_46_12]OGL31452.1 MAG: hypothetical protein A3E76_02930 [Candidatus Saccharibacteria bacterium RIFCSPHIGHO2_12_FULL_44_22]
MSNLNLITKSNAVRNILFGVAVLIFALAGTAFISLASNGFDGHRTMLEAKNDAEQAVYGWDYYNPELMELNIADEIADLRESATDSVSLNSAVCASRYRNDPGFQAGVGDIAATLGVKLSTCR